MGHACFAAQRLTSKQPLNGDQPIKKGCETRPHPQINIIYRNQINWLLRLVSFYKSLGNHLIVGLQYHLVYATAQGYGLQV